MYENLKIEIIRFSLLFSLVFSLGWASGQWLLVSLLVFAGYAVWHLRQVYLMERWILGFDRNASEQLSGIWQYASETTARYQKSGRKRKRRITRLLKRFNKTLELMPDGIMILDTKQRLEWMNPAAGRMFGLSRGHGGQKVEKIIEDAELLAFIVRDSDEGSLEIVSPVNQRMELEIKVASYDEGRKLITAHDISEVKKVESIRREFLANVSHELRTPLTVISGYLEMLEKEALPEAYQQALTASFRQVKRMHRLVADLLMLSRIELHDQQPTVEETVNVPEVLNALQSDARALSDQAGHILSLQTESWLGIKGNEAELTSAFGNLLFNAVLHTPPGTKVIVRWQQKLDKLVFSVQDNGPGIDPSHLAHLTERFYRVDKARSRDRGGTGLGLSIVSHVVQRHEGEVKIVSEPGCTVFSCEFPETRAIMLE